MKIPASSIKALAISLSFLAINALSTNVFAQESAVEQKQETAIQKAEQTKPVHKEILKKADATVKEKTNKVKESLWYPTYHLASPANLMGKPSGIPYFKDKYHIFYQYNPFDTEKEASYIGHAVSTDLVNWSKEQISIAPSEAYDSQGIFAGSAITADDLLYIVYTGRKEIKNGEKTEIIDSQNLAMSRDGINFGKSANNPVIQRPPHYSVFDFLTKDFMNPYVWKQSDRYYALVGSHYEKSKDGAVLLFKSNDLRNWVFINISAIGKNSEMGTTWESPALVHIDGKDVLLISPYGIKPQGKNFLNKFQAGWFIGKLDYDTGKFKQSGAFGLFDKGFDLYAPQVIKRNDGKVIMIASLSMPETKQEEVIDGWSGMMTIPRELNIINNRIVTTPIEEIKKLRTEPLNYKNQNLGEEREFSHIKGDSYELEVNADLEKANTFTIKLRMSSTQETVLSYDKSSKILKLNRDKSGHNLSGEREAEVPLLEGNLLKLRIFVDKSSIEVFANDGQVVMSSRIYPDKSSTGIKFFSDGNVIIKDLNFYKLKAQN